MAGGNFGQDARMHLPKQMSPNAIRLNGAGKCGPPILAGYKAPAVYSAVCRNSKSGSMAQLALIPIDLFVGLGLEAFSSLKLSFQPSGLNRNC